MSSGYAEGTQIIVTFGNSTATGVIDKNDSWYVLITAPETEGHYIITAMVGDLNYSLSVNVIDSAGDGDGDGDDDGDDVPNFWDMNDNGLLFMGIFILVLVIIIALIGIAFFLKKRKREVESDEGYWGEEYHDDYYDKYEYEKYPGVDQIKRRRRRKEKYDEEYAKDHDEELEPELESEAEEYEEEVWDEGKMEEIDEVE